MLCYFFLLNISNLHFLWFIETGTNRLWLFESFAYPLDERKFNDSQAVVVVDVKVYIQNLFFTE